ncbi:hypothetical protein A3I27_02550 [Candidatus Giovannonibacteria bacterium RIFCSPLOWO2_02_FULL_43_11b]|uniref:Nudix hydrolase domain-containing protein n=1 Tax=Candidatus Giovannonibacteria bacterium RIFCSPHIGHO2_12_FULL_43_15 TaxID=1798341 RepID=A0A1F5WNV2_9BACT|nr:MAG: hypothetical protein A2739_03425 [Candidatus Giovannonibacteria bacterium RIFCSPHIGHO2_01_FULL_43_100]OGF66312.1 MAG: hypothetical protein A3B97_01920 [Candidatus Giovannonibacteria bacterium RIFCSPHIGHO2_02_FULL_43_32]OGF77382.1 MAG: hypothetical protein A3F23_00340 [Candidatus Giovannonibacteria bacterium RIFCSPHIGHO2_12_FULL_43_15]OGF79205.1 MAG: hypothetical protein A3A15_01105 [Candidatus Giovannonibacteria bacterium RIFCSPLOWO2_01_FULL_43_60]OGF90522.1 MAG: hypothetical protein A3
MGALKKIYGLPVMNLQNFSGLMRARKVASFRKLTKTISFEEYLKNELTQDEKKELRFAPKTEVVKFRDPNGNTFTGFRSAHKSGVLIFALLPGNLLPICAEFRHGSEKVVLNLPAGLIEPTDANPKVAAKREFREEIGITLKKLIPLNSGGVPIDARVSTRKNFFFLGMPALPLKVKKQRLEKSEFAARFLIHIDHWLALMKLGIVDDCSMAATLLALKKLKSETLHFIRKIR